MKKIYLILMGVAVLSFATLSCSKDAVDPSQQEQNQNKENPTSEGSSDKTPVPEGMIRLTFGVSQEGDASANEGDDTKTTWDGSTHAWNNDDQIRIFWGPGAEDYKDATVKNNQVDVVVGDAEYYYAVYPITGAFAFREGGTIDFGIPILQSGSFKDANMMAAATSKTAATFNFKNLTHIFKFHLTNDSPYDRFQFCTNNGSIVVNTYGVSFDSEGNVTIGKRTEEISGFPNSKYVRLHDGMTPGGDYYFAVVPGAQYSLGFGLQARISGETGDYSVAALSKGTIDTTNPREITNLGDLDPYIHSDWFITADGTGNGTSWDNPGGPALLRSLLVMPSTFTVDQAKKNHTIRLNNAKIHLKEGTYNFQTILADTGQKAFLDGAFHTDVNNVTVIDGGYPSSATGKDLSGYDPVHHPSVVVSNQAAQNDRAFYFNGARLYDFTFKGLSFENNPSGTVYNTPGGAVAVNGGTNGKLKFEDCSFSIKTTNGSGGGALSFRGDAEVNAEFKNCVFSSCESTSYGGAIWINTTSHNLTFDGCTITDNKATNGGGFIYVQNSGVVTFQNSTSFERNTSDEESGLGGAIYTHKSASGTINLDHCSFSENSAFNGGAIYYASASGTINLDHCSFSENSAINGGAITVIKNASVTLQNGCVINKCVSTENGGAIFNHGTVVLDNSTISNCVGKVGGAIYTDGNLTIKNNSTISGNTMYSGGTDGGGIFCIYGTDGSAAPTVDVENSCFVSNSSTNGAAIFGGTGDAEHFVVTRVFNTLFKSNAASGGGSSGANRNGGCVYATDYNYLLFANCTFSDNTVGTGGIISMGRSGTVDYNKLYLVSSTIDGENDGIQRNSKVYEVYNSIVIGNKTNTAQNLSINHSIWGTGSKVNIYGASVLKSNGNFTNAATSEDITFALGSFKNGVYPLNSDYSTVYTQGMSADDLKTLTFTSISLTDDQTLLLAKDQKGNDRGDSKIMGAYVKTTDQTE